MKHATRVENLVVTIGIVLFCIFFLYPIWIAVCGAFKTFEESLNSLVFMPPRQPTIEPFLNAWRQLQMPIVVTIQVAALTIVLSLVLGMMGGYVLRRAKFKAVGFLIVTCVLGIYIPPETKLLPLLLMLRVMRLYNTNIGLSVALAQALVPLSTILYRQYFAQIPDGYFEAAEMDGATHFQMLRSIVIPLSKIPTMTVAVLTFSIGWNVYLKALVFTSGDNRYRVVGITIEALNYAAQMFASYNEMLAGSLIMAFVPVTLYLFAQKYVTHGFRSMGNIDR